MHPQRRRQLVLRFPSVSELANALLTQSEGPFFLVDAKNEDEARAVMETLPLAKEHFVG
jgi:hypothetical protein